MNDPTQNDKAPAAENGAGLNKPTRGNSSHEQRQRLLRSLEARPVSTLHARGPLDVMHPGGRIMELRRMGHQIDTVWIEAETDCGKKHRVALYVLRQHAANDERLDGQA